MSKATAKVETVSTPTIRKACDRVVTNLCKAYDARANSSTLLETTIAACNTVFGKVPPNEAELNYIADETSKKQGWTGTAGEKFAKSQVRRICKNAIELPKAIKLYRSQNDGKCTMATALVLCTELQTAEGNVKKAVESLSTKRAAKNAPAKKLTHKQELILRLSEIVNMEKLDPAFKKGLYALTKKHGIKLS